MVIAAAVWPERDLPDPTFEGKPLSRWLYDYETYNFIGSKTFWHHDEAVKSIGTNAIPMLLHKLRARESPLKDRLAAWARSLRLVRSGNPSVSAAQQNKAGWRGFHALGADAAPAVPALINIYEQELSDSSMCATAHSLGSIGPPAGAAVRALLRHATNGSLAVRIETIRVLGEIRCAPESVVPMLARIAGDPNDQARETAISSLGLFGPEAKIALPLLVRATGTNNIADCRFAAVEALGRIHSDPPFVLGTLVTALSDPDHYIRWAAISALGEYGTNARPAIGELRKALADSDEFNGARAARSLSKIDPNFVLEAE